MLHNLIRIRIISDHNAADVHRIACRYSWASNNHVLALRIRNWARLWPSLDVAVVQAINLHAAYLLIFINFLHILRDLHVPGRLSPLHANIMNRDRSILLSDVLRMIFVLRFKIVSVAMMCISDKLSSISELRPEIEGVEQELHHMV